MASLWRVYCNTESIYKYTRSLTAPTTCPTNAQHIVNAASVNTVDYNPAGRMYFGDGSDGNVTIAANTTLTRDMYYENLTINVGTTLTTGGYRVFVSETLVVAGTISAAGGSAVGRVAGTVPYTAKVLGSGATGGTGGVALATGTSGGSLTSNTRMGGLGGAGGASASLVTVGVLAGGAAGTGTVCPVTYGGTTVFMSVAALLRGRDMNNTLIAGGSGGGGGAGGAVTVGGGGGAGGGIIVIAARMVTQTGTITVAGGNGAAGGTSAGGGAGGGGGCVCIVTTTIGGISPNVGGGLGGAPGLLAVAGAAGNPGQSCIVIV